MVRYQGKYLGTISETWPKPSADRLVYWRIWRTLGGILKCDVGKQVYDNEGIIQVESAGQRVARQAAERDV